MDSYKKDLVSKEIAKSVHAFNVWDLKCSINKKVGDLKAEIIKSDEPIKFQDLDKSKFKPIRQWQSWGKRKEWAEAFPCAWFHFTGKVPKKAIGKQVICRIKLQGEGLVFNPDGIVLQGLSQILREADIFHALIGKQQIEITDCATGDEQIDLYVDAGFNGKFKFRKCTAYLRRCDICIHDEEISQYYYDYLDLYFIMLVQDKKSERFKEIDKALKKSYKIYKKEGAAAARAFLKPVLEKKAPYKSTTHYCIGHSHLDLAWLWPFRETKRKIARTFANQLRNIELYDDFIFSASQPQQFQWLKDEYPELFERVKQAVAAGRIDLQGGMWVESDLMMTGGESLIRQFLYGQRFWKENFDYQAKTCWLPDDFGFPAYLPQLVKKCGLENFFTLKLKFNIFNKPLHHTFNWEGIDGSTILAHMEPLGECNSGNTALAIHKSEDWNMDKDVCDKAIVLYGDGDGGGGPGEGHVEYMKRHSAVKEGIDGITPCRTCHTDEFFEDIKDMRDNFITHKGELYFERHQGCYTSQAKMKKYNRRIEEKLHKVEWLAALAYANGLAYYDTDQMEKIWKEVLLYQFHDIIPGTSIKRVYDEVYPRYEELFKELDGIEKTLLDALGANKAMSALNPIDFDRCEYVKVGDDWYTADLKAHSIGKLIPAVLDTTQFKYDDNTIENANLKVTFGKNGEIVSLIDKKYNKELVKEYFNKFVVYSDPRMTFNAWDIMWGKDKKTNYMMMKKWEFKLKSSTTYVDGVYLVRESSYKYHNSAIVQKVKLAIDGDMVLFDTTVDWHEDLKMLRADFVPTVFSDNVKCNIQFGNFDRTTSEDDRDEEYNPKWAQFEVCAHKFVNLDDTDYGLALINDCKYGYRAKSGFLSMALLRAPKYPDPTCDRGTHTFSYAIYPHKEKFEDTDLMSKGYCFNNPVQVIEQDLDVDTLVKFDSKNIIIETIKVSEDGEGIIVRAYESLGQSVKTALDINFDNSSIYECNMLENKERLVKGKTFEFTPYEIKTIYITK